MFTDYTYSCRAIAVNIAETFLDTVMARTFSVKLYFHPIHNTYKMTVYRQIYAIRQAVYIAYSCVYSRIKSTTNPKDKLLMIDDDMQMLTLLLKNKMFLIYIDNS
jgi:hypothetical protein